MPYTYEYPRPSVTVDCVVFGLNGDRNLRVLLIRRADDPFAGKLALPGGFVNVSDAGNQGEDLEVAARRELDEETGVKPDHLEQLATFGTPKRDPRGRVISVAYMTLVRSTEHAARAGSDASAAEWTLVETATKAKLAFDHGEILALALQRLRAKLRYAPIGFSLLPPTFTISELRGVYEAVLGVALDPANFQKKALATGVLVATGSTKTGKHPAAKLYRFDKRAYERALGGGRFTFDL
jgi:8-oxo-dGTP diphosphatase